MEKTKENEKSKNIKTASIIGYGRFGATLYRLLGNDFKFTLYDTNSESRQNAKKHFNNNVNCTVTNSLEEIYNSDIIFYCVPISQFESVIKEHKQYVRPHHLLVDVLSVKTYPKEIFQKYLNGQNVLLTHPMFGPDSSKNGFEGLPMILDGELCNPEDCNFFKELYQNKGLKIVEMTSDEHDKLAANSQGIAHLLGRVLDEYGFKSTPIDSNGAKALNELMVQTCNDTWELFSNLQTYNPYTKHMRLNMIKSFEKVSNKVLPTSVEDGTTVFGIQGGPGSFNQQALGDYVSRHNISNYETKFLYTTERVLESLFLGEIDFGLFATHNSVGGIVEETVKAMSKYNFNIVEHFSILIAHHLMKLPSVEASKITTIMAHPQVIKQCKATLNAKYSKLETISGEGDLIDTATAAKALYDGDLPKNYAILGSIAIRDLFDFDVIENDLQDNKENYTHFLMVSR